MITTKFNPLMIPCGTRRGTGERSKPKDYTGTVTSALSTCGTAHFIFDIATADGGKTIIVHDSKVSGIERGAKGTFTCAPNLNANTTSLAGLRLTKAPVILNQPKDPSPS